MSKVVTTEHTSTKKKILDPENFFAFFCKEKHNFIHFYTHFESSSRILWNPLILT